MNLDGGLVRLIELDKAWKASGYEDRERIALEFTNYFQDHKGSLHSDAGIESKPCNAELFQQHFSSLTIFGRVIRLFGEISHAVFEVAEVQHSVIVSLDAIEENERLSALFAAEKICAFSKKGSNVSLRLIRVLRHTYKHEMAANTARTLALQVLQTNPSTDLFVMILKTMTELATKFPFHIQSQISLLLEVFQTSTSGVIRNSALRCVDSGVVKIEAY
ncbi:hypothetical protein HDU67_002973 [Dinochytrium kinnereticum]|nr:hypothetical protein HDU67_002973 [Dinochytrium kinnereticum]